MSLLDLFRGKSRNKPSPPNIPVDLDGNGERIYYEDIVSSVKEELERRRGERAMLELQWTLNANFLAGHQNCDIDVRTRTIAETERVTREDCERRIYNRIAPLMETRQANLGSVKYDMVVKPRSSEAEDCEKAMISTKLLEYCQNVTDFNAEAEKMTAWCELCGTAFTLSWWDTLRGEAIGESVIEIQTENGDVKETVNRINSGDIAFGLLTSYEVFPYSLTVDEIADQHDIIIERVLDIGEIYDLYGRKYDGEELESYVLSPIPGASGGHGISNAVFGMAKETRKNCEKVIMYIENPSREYSAGRLIIIIRDEIIYYGSLPGGVNPLVSVKSKPVAGQFFGKSVIQDLIPLQRSYNDAYNKLQDFIKTIANNTWLVPSGSLEETDAEGIESGSILVYRPEFGGKPEIVKYPEPPAIVQQQLDRISSDMEYTAGVSQLMVVGSAPSGVTSGTAIDNLRQIDATRMSLTADSIRNSVIATARIWLRLNKEFSSGYRVIRIAGDDEKGSVYTWCADDINSYDIEYTAENELRHSRDSQRNDFIQAFNMGLLFGEDGRLEAQYVERGRELFELNSYKSVTEAELQRKNAVRENSYFGSGAASERGIYDDDAAHLSEHIKYALSAEFRLLRRKSPEYAAVFDRHIEEHRAALARKEAENMRKMLMGKEFSNG